MARTTCPPGVWTSLPDTGGDMLVEARGMGFYVDVGGGEPANAGDAYALASNSSMVVAAGLAVAVQPAQPVSSVVAVSSLV